MKGLAHQLLQTCSALHTALLRVSARLTAANMGKKHTKDRMFVSASEWANDWGGKKTKKTGSQYRPLAFDCCALSLSPFQTPVCSEEGVMYDILNIMPWVKQHKKNPLTGAPMAAKDLIRLNMAKNGDGRWHCPVTCKVFNDNSRIVAIKTSGNVYAAEAVEELNVKAKCWTDLLTGEPMTKKDIILLNDPNDQELLRRRDISNFTHLQQVRDEKQAEAAKLGPIANIRTNATTTGIFREIKEKRKRDQQEIADKEEKEAQEAASKLAKQVAAGEPIWKRQKLLADDICEGKQASTGATSRSLTSTAVGLSVANIAAFATDEEVREARWARLRKLKKKAYAQLQTSLGNLNLELHLDMVPRTAENFLGLCEKEYYDGAKFHRVIPNFMIQGGDPTGTGRGGESLWGGSFKDEFDSRLLHDARGQLCMANSGPHSNKSQFYITFKSCQHLDCKHSVFGRVVGGLDVLARLEGVEVDSKDRPREEVVIRKAVVFQNPIPEMEALFEAEVKEKIAAREAAAEEAKKRRVGQPTPKAAAAAVPVLTASTSSSSGVGKYIKKSAATATAASTATAAEPAAAAPPPKKKKASGFSNNFSGW